MTIEQRRSNLRRLHRQHHASCPVCGDRNLRGLRARFTVCPDGVECNFVCPHQLEGYAEHVHGGVIASLVDGAMTHCLFSYGVCAVTGKLAVRWVRPVRSRHPIRLHAWVERARGPLYQVRGQLEQQGRVAVEAEASFVNKPESPA